MNWNEMFKCALSHQGFHIFETRIVNCEIFNFPFPVSFETHTQKYNLELTAHIPKVGEARPPWNFHHLGCLLRRRGFLLMHLFDS